MDVNIPDLDLNPAIVAVTDAAGVAASSPAASSPNTVHSSPPFKITTSPADSFLVRKLTLQMAPVWRGPNPDPKARAENKASKVKPLIEPAPPLADRDYFPIFKHAAGASISERPLILSHAPH